MTNARTSKTVIVYRNPEGNEPFTDWLNRLRDPNTGGVFSNASCAWNRAIMEILSRWGRA
jgi:hypothetical protein